LSKKFTSEERREKEGESGNQVPKYITIAYKNLPPQNKGFG